MLGFLTLRYGGEDGETFEILGALSLFRVRRDKVRYVSHVGNFFMGRPGANYGYGDFPVIKYFRVRGYIGAIVDMFGNVGDMLGMKACVAEVGVCLVRPAARVQDNSINFGISEYITLKMATLRYN